MQSILIAGDSWGVGVFSGQGDSYRATGEGIHSILTEMGHEVINISKMGIANALMLDRLEGKWHDTGSCLFGADVRDKVKFDLESIDHIVFLQTDIFRERYYYAKKYPEDPETRWKTLEQEFIIALRQYTSLNEIIDNYFDKFYTRLNSFAVKHNKKILMIGGWSQLHPSISRYSNLVAVVPSATKLLIPELKRDVYMSDPEWYSLLANDKEFMSNVGTAFKQLTIDAEDKLKLIYKHWNEVHPNLQGYRRLVDEILPYLVKNY
jgi:hypothetical protein